jgi:hypothetical protein
MKFYEKVIFELLDGLIALFDEIQEDCQKLAKSAQKREDAWKRLTAPLTVDPHHFDWIDKNIQDDES